MAQGVCRSAGPQTQIILHPRVPGTAGPPPRPTLRSLSLSLSLATDLATRPDRARWPARYAPSTSPTPRPPSHPRRQRGADGRPGRHHSTKGTTSTAGSANCSYTDMFAFQSVIHPPLCARRRPARGRWTGTYESCSGSRGRHSVPRKNGCWLEKTHPRPPTPRPSGQRSVKARQPWPQ